MKTLIFLFRKTINLKGILRISLILLFCCITLFAKAIGNGCYVGGVLYTANTSYGAIYFYRSPGNLNSICGFEPTGNQSGRCYLYNSGKINKNSSYTRYNNSYSNGWEEINCPIDEEIWILLIPISILSYLRLKGRF